MPELIESFYVPTRLTFGRGAVNETADELRKLTDAKVLVVTDPGLVEAGIAGRVLEVLNRSSIAFTAFSNVESNPSIDTVTKALAIYQEADCGALIGLGGGSAMDVAKAVGVLATNGGDIRDYEGIDKIGKPLPPLICIPTTTGTGSEVTRFTVIMDRTRAYKMPIASVHVYPKVAILDPELTTSAPPHIIAATAMDALTHGIESFVSLRSNAFTEPLALAAIRIIARNLQNAVATRSVEVMSYLLYASTLAGMAFTNTRLGNVHAMSHPLGGYYNLHHGLANAILLPYVMAFNREACPEKFARLAEAMGKDVHGLDEQSASYEAIEAVKYLACSVGIPTRLSDVGVNETHIEAMTDDAMRSGNILVNPRRTTRDDIKMLYYQAL